jgi:hypothetical protein
VAIEVGLEGLVWIVLEFSSFKLVFPPLQLGAVGPYPVRGPWFPSYFCWAVTGSPRYLRYKTLTRFLLTLKWLSNEVHKVLKAEVEAKRSTNTRRCQDDHFALMTNALRIAQAGKERKREHLHKTT